MYNSRLIRPQSSRTAFLLRLPLIYAFQFISDPSIVLSHQCGHLFYIHRSLSDSMRVRLSKSFDRDSGLILLINSKNSGTNTLVSAELASWKLGHELPMN